MEERRALLKKMEEDHHKKDWLKWRQTTGKGWDIQFHFDKMKEILFATQNTL
jgi:hypothetical protein